MCVHMSLMRRLAKRVLHPEASSTDIYTGTHCCHGANMINSYLYMCTSHREKYNSGVLSFGSHLIVLLLFDNGIGNEEVKVKGER